MFKRHCAKCLALGLENEMLQMRVKEYSQLLQLQREEFARTRRYNPSYTDWLQETVIRLMTSKEKGAKK